MRIKVFYRFVRPYVSAAAIIATTAMLVFAIFFTKADLQWVTFLTGILVAATLALSTRGARSEWIIARRTAKLSLAQDKLAQQTELRKIAEKNLAAGKARLDLIDKVLSIMVAYVGSDGHCHYHNRAFREWLGLRAEQIDGRPMRGVLGVKAYEEIAAAVRQVLEGKSIVNNDWVQVMPGGAVYRLAAQYVPHLDDDSKVAGFYFLLTDITERRDIHATAEPDAAAAERAWRDLTAAKVEHVESTGHDLFVESFSRQVTGRKDAASYIITAIEKDEFSLFCQTIVPLAAGAIQTQYYEILVRLMEEEESMMPPGAFFPVAEKYGLMPRLDRWVVQHVVQWVSASMPAGGKAESRMFFINLTNATIGDPGFLEFLRDQLKKNGVPGSTLCFELTNSALAAGQANAGVFARHVRKYGCRVALSGFGRDRISFDLLRGVQVDFLKIDGSIILGILRGPVDLARVISIHRVAKTIGVKTIAEFVESEDIAAKLRELGIDFAQGFGISHPRPLTEIG